ncbi:phage late control D family protein [Helicobacter sp.]|uniref:phage late control D family protein n=1 Tax=Helicobacter sp. TaxID=218 RepID=UPI0019AFA79C|nr:contractile injection system protein, VgrG/Pvc8 family [Helicobacter sp.]MBD5164581.1 hypothetical protein [Helicobacter sp.]
MKHFTPDFKILANEKDVTAHIAKNLIELSFKDEAGIVSDEITLSVYGAFKRPKYKDKLKLWLGYKESGLWYCGSFAVQSSERTESSTTITATGVDFSSGLKKRKNRAWEKLSLKEIVERIAKEHDLSAVADFGEIKIAYAGQHDRSDLTFLQKFAKDFDAIFNVKDNQIVFLRKENESKSIIPKSSISLSECSSYRIKYSNKTLYGSCKAIWHDTKENKIKEVIVGSDEGEQIRLEQSFKNAAEALAKAKAKLERAKCGIVSGSLEIYGTCVFAGGILSLSNAGEDSGEYRIKSVHHSLSADSFTTSVEFEK